MTARALDRPGRGSAVSDAVALAEIELCGELMIAAAAAEAAGQERLSPARIDEVLGAGEDLLRPLPGRRSPAP